MNSIVRAVMKKKCNIIFIVIAATACVYYLFGKDDISISNVQWECSHGACNVSFNIANRSNNKSQRKIRIRAHSQRMIGKGAIVNEIVGEKNLTLSIAPFERRQIQEKLVLTGMGKVHLVAVNEWNDK